jgi:23S rRNA (adenine2030-N6)-methyltransferase
VGFCEDGNILLAASSTATHTRAFFYTQTIMLSYLHAYHAGNYADVLKHTVLVQVLLYLTMKDKPLCYVDTHSGAGVYKLSSKEALKTAEFKQGIAPLWNVSNRPAALSAYVELVKKFNPTPELRLYPGSCMIAAQLLRPDDRLVLCELHPSEAQLLSKTFSGYRNVHCFDEDGFSKGVASCPPIERRGVMLIDPSYEVKSDYMSVVEHLKNCHRRFATGVYLLWYPVVDASRTDGMLKAVRNSGIRNVDLYELGVDSDHSKPGMTGTGMVVINPTYGLREVMLEVLTFLSQQLGPDAYYRVEAWVPK